MDSSPPIHYYVDMNDCNPITFVRDEMRSWVVVARTSLRRRHLLEQLYYSTLLIKNPLVATTQT